MYARFLYELTTSRQFNHLNLIRETWFNWHTWPLQVSILIISILAIQLTDDIAIGKSWIAVLLSWKKVNRLHLLDSFSNDCGICVNWVHDYQNCQWTVVVKNTSKPAEVQDFAFNNLIVMWKSQRMPFRLFSFNMKASIYQHYKLLNSVILPFLSDRFQYTILSHRRLNNPSDRLVILAFQSHYILPKKLPTKFRLFSGSAII